VIEQARQQIGGSVAAGMVAQQRLAEALGENGREQARIEQGIAASQARLDALDREIERLDAEIPRTEQRIEADRAEIAVLARLMYQEPSSFLLRVLRAGSMQEAVAETSDLTAAALRADALKRQLADDLKQLQDDRALRERNRAAESQAREALASARTELQGLAAEEQAIGDELQASIAESQSALSGAGQQQASVVQRIVDLRQRRLEALIAAAEEQVWRQQQLWAALNQTSAPALVPFAAPHPAADGGAPFIWPEPGAVITQGFGPSTLWLEPAMFGYAHFHTGVDLAAPYGTPVLAAADGVVAVVGSGTTGYGNYVTIVHGGGLVTLYGHLSTALVQPGQTVRQGQPIGAEGSTGASTGPHVHFEVRLNGTPVDPGGYLPAFGSG